jgi:Tol biopolymer transport system component
MAFSNLIPRRLTKDPGRDASPVFSAGDAWIVFESNRSGNYELYSIRTNAEEDISIRNLTYSEANEYVPYFSPDGLWLLYLSDYARKMDIYRRPWP